MYFTFKIKKLIGLKKIRSYCELKRKFRIFKICSQEYIVESATLQENFKNNQPLMVEKQAGPSPKFQVAGQFARAAGSWCFCPLLDNSGKCRLWPKEFFQGSDPGDMSVYEPSDTWKNWPYCSKLFWKFLPQGN